MRVCTCACLPLMTNQCILSSGTAYALHGLTVQYHKGPARRLLCTRLKIMHGCGQTQDAFMKHVELRLHVLLVCMYVR